MSKNEDTGARLAAIKDISTERLIELAQAEAAGLVTISTSPAEIYQQAIAKEEGHQDGGVEMVIRELERLASLDLDLAKGTIGTSRTIAIIRETLPYVRAAASLLRTRPDNQPNEPLTLEELREMDGHSIYVLDRVYPPYSGWWIIGWTKDDLVLAAAKRRGTQYTVQNYGIDWVAYRLTPKE